MTKRKLAIRIYEPFSNPDFWDIGKYFLMGKLPFGYGFFIGIVDTYIDDFPIFMYVSDYE